MTKHDSTLKQKSTAIKHIQDIYQSLYKHYGDLHWWPADSPYEVMVGAILTQNTVWSNVEMAISNFEGKLSPEYILSISEEQLIDLIRPAGFFNQKSRYLVNVTEWFKQYQFDTEQVKQIPFDPLRKELLAIKGVGKETADSILLYAFGYPTFVIDAYTYRVCERYGVTDSKNYDSVKQLFEEAIEKDVDVYNAYHAMVVMNAKEFCRKKPKCDGCPLYAKCNYASEMYLRER